MQLKAAIQASLQDMQENFGNENSEKDPDAQLENDLPEKPIASNDWRAYLGSDESPKIEIVIRYPDGNKEKVIFPCTSKLKVFCDGLRMMSLFQSNSSRRFSTFM